jgi:hypothetical protein
MSLLLDITSLDPDCCNHGLELLHKANSERPPDDKIWKPHPNKFLRALVEAMTQRGLVRIEDLMKAVGKLLTGKLKPQKSGDTSLYRLTPAELSRLKTFLEHGDPGAWAASEWMLAVDYLVQRYLPQDFAITEGEWAAKRAVLMGRVQAVMNKAPSAKAIDKVLDAVATVPMVASTKAIMEYGAAHTAELIVALSDAARHRMKLTILAHQSESLATNRSFAAGRESLQTLLFDDFGTLNRDWRRIAVTEIGEMANQAFITQFNPGAKVKRIERYEDACPFCKKIDGMVFTVVSPDKPNKDGWTEIWEGKTNVGRSASPMKRVGDQLVPRDVDELWHVAAGLQHPNCRGSWVPYGPSEKPGDDPALMAYIQKIWESTKEPVPS